MASYYRKFISGFSDIASPLNRLTQTDMSFVWDENCENAFQTIKEELMSSPVEVFPEPNGDFILFTDASVVGVGTVLVQEDGEGEKRVVYLMHRKPSQLKNVKHPNGKLACWTLELKEYVYTTEHKPGNMMQHADALSRAPVNSVRISTLSWTALEETQNLDDDILLVRRWVLNGLRPDAKPKDTSPMLKALYNVFESLVVEKNVLRRKWIDEDGKETLQIDAHEQVGHLGIAKTFEMIQSGFYWPGFYKDVKTFCKSCEICAKNKVVPRPRSPMKPFDIVPVPFYMIGVDLIGPSKLARQGNKYILSIIDYYSKYAEAVALPNQEAEKVTSSSFGTSVCQAWNAFSFAHVPRP
ncbi:Transposon Ty3-G Gag-Pol poly [Paramuricea clavata]|uniref:Transposon Ty3-G Gag-Pol poly n=1 Tax=Paramuricea clavata TaxID=317549 RepID=A0A6S7H265_PARCT|nr:Transposon Ty3-G Gag-Pol poly [Paramuricea clavata]